MVTTDLERANNRHNAIGTWHIIRDAAVDLMNFVVLIFSTLVDVNFDYSPKSPTSKMMGPWHVLLRSRFI